MSHQGCMEKWVASDPIFPKCILSCNLSASQFWDNPSHSWQAALPTKTQQDTHLQVKPLPALGILAKKRQTIPLAGEKWTSLEGR